MIRVIAVALIVSQSPVYAEGNTCVPARTAIRFAQAQPGFKEYEILSRERAAIVSKFYNAIPPVGHEDWPLVITIDAANGTGKIFVGRDGQICNAAEIEPMAWAVLKHVIGGVEI